MTPLFMIAKLLAKVPIARRNRQGSTLKVKTKMGRLRQCLLWGHKPLESVCESQKAIGIKNSFHLGRNLEIRLKIT